MHKHLLIMYIAPKMIAVHIATQVGGPPSIRYKLKIYSILAWKSIKDMKSTTVK